MSCAGSAPRACPRAWVGSRAVSGIRRRGTSTVDVPMYQVDAVVRRAPSLQRPSRGAARPRSTETIKGARC